MSKSKAPKIVLTQKEINFFQKLVNRRSKEIVDYIKNDLNMVITEPIPEKSMLKMIMDSFNNDANEIDAEKLEMDVCESDEFAKLQKKGIVQDGDDEDFED